MTLLHTGKCALRAVSFYQRDIMMCFDQMVHYSDLRCCKSHGPLAYLAISCLQNGADLGLTKLLRYKTGYM